MWWCSGSTMVGLRVGNEEVGVSQFFWRKVQFRQVRSDIRRMSDDQWLDGVRTSGKGRSSGAWAILGLGMNTQILGKRKNLERFWRGFRGGEPLKSTFRVHYFVKLTRLLYIYCFALVFSFYVLCTVLHLNSNFT